MFIHSPYELPKLKRITDKITGKRVYEVSGEHYTSVTTILSELNKAAIMRWRARVGAEKANKVSRKALKRGTRLDKQIETYLRTGTVQLDEFDYFSLFPQIKPVLDKHITMLYNLQGMVYSHTLKVAGSFDCLAAWDGKPAMIDFKSSLKLKEEAWIESYFLQCALYSMCLWEMLGLRIQQIVIVIGVDGEPEPQIFIKNIKDYIEPAVKIVKQYHLTK